MITQTALKMLTDKAQEQGLLQIFKGDEGALNQFNKNFPSFADRHAIFCTLVEPDFNSAVRRIQNERKLSNDPVTKIIVKALSMLPHHRLQDKEYFYNKGYVWTRNGYRPAGEVFGKHSFWGEALPHVPLTLVPILEEIYTYKLTRHPTESQKFSLNEPVLKALITHLVDDPEEQGKRWAHLEQQDSEGYKDLRHQASLILKMVAKTINCALPDSVILEASQSLDTKSKIETKPRKKDISVLAVQDSKSAADEKKKSRKADTCVHVAPSLMNIERRQMLFSSALDGLTSRGTITGQERMMLSFCFAPAAAGNGRTIEEGAKQFNKTKDAISELIERVRPELEPFFSSSLKVG
jgi:hypothetical protein